MSNIINICLDPGHGGSQPGAVSSKYGYREKDIVLDISLKVRDYLLYATKSETGWEINDYCQQHSNLIEVLMTRVDDSSVSLKDRCVKANKAKSKLFVSIHCNSCTSEDPTGIETWCYDSATSKSRLLATNIQNALMNRVKPFSLNIKGKDQPI